MKDKKILAYIALVGAILCFSGNFMLGGIAISSIPLMSLMFVKWGTAAIPMLILAHYIERPNWKLVLKSWNKILLLSMLGIAGYSFMFYEALSTTSPINASLINAFNPALIVIASALFLHERLNPWKVGGIIIAFAGVIWVLTGGNLNVLTEQKFNTGDIWMLGVISCWTAYIILVKKGVDIPPLTNCSLQMTFFTLLMIPYTLFNGLILPKSNAAMWSLAYITIFPSAVAYGLWNYGTKYVEPSTAGQTLNLVVPFTAVMTLLSGGEITSVDIVGGILILIGVYITLHFSREKNVKHKSVIKSV
ncbi:DMT family transporter [Acinetobacter baumannii]|uniref:DMT family transporter n=1 Tax=Acinetobacter baumannii TaxID=470 RepID=UPI00234C737C|nr:DMT family transporter [Acinetobacter baumannii]MDC7429292.1 DMT family transporter [Acinetobacter baumannii]MDC7466697.1 DMT family transporter [Acinetobacter baumannii]